MKNAEIEDIDDDELAFQEFKKKFGKSYSVWEEPAKKVNFKKNLATLKSINCGSYCHVTSYFDLNDKQLKGKNFLILGMRGLKVEDNFNDPNIVRVNADGSKFENSTKKNEPADVKAGTSTSSTTKTATQTTVSAYPTTMNWKTSGIVTPVRDQGDCGSCWAFATVAMFESEAVRIKGRSVTSLNLAEQFLLKCDRNNYGCNGGNCISSA